MRKYVKGSLFFTDYLLDDVGINMIPIFPLSVYLLLIIVAFAVLVVAGFPFGFIGGAAAFLIPVAVAEGIGELRRRNYAKLSSIGQSGPKSARMIEWRSITEFNRSGQRLALKSGSKWHHLYIRKQDIKNTMDLVNSKTVLDRKK